MKKKPALQRIVKLMVKAGPASDGKPIKHYGAHGCSGAVFPIEGWRDFDCVVWMDNGDKYEVGFKGFKAPEVEFIERTFRKSPCVFTKLN